MSTEKENWQESYEDGSAAGRDGNNRYNRESGYNNDRYYNSERSDRPNRPSYNKYNNDRPARPRINRDNNGGDRPRFNQNSGGDRPRFNQNNDGNRPRFNQNERPQRSYNRETNYNSYDRGNNNNGNRSYDNRDRSSSYNRDRSSSYNRENRPWRQNSEDNRGGERPRFDRPNPNSVGGGYRREGDDGRARRPRFNSGDSNYRNNSNYRPRPRTEGYDPNAKYSRKKQIEYKEQFVDPNAPIRLNKFLANAGICSRREADEFITAGVVSVNGEVVTELGTKIKRADLVKFHDEPVSVERKVYILLNKPKDCVTTSEDPQDRRTVMDLIQGACSERIYPVGRLDRNTTGVLLLTNDGDLASKLTHPKYLKKKIYHVYLDKTISRSDMDQIAGGVQLEDGEIRADAISYVSDQDRAQVGIEIHSGKNRIVRRIFESLGYKVVKLDRVYFAGLTKKNLRRGDWRYLSEQEVNFLRMGSFE